MKQLMMLMSAATLLVGMNPAFAHSVSNAKAAELSLHRLERLVILKKIENSFENKVKSLKLETIAHGDEEEPSFKSTIAQYAGADGTQKTLAVVMNEEGKALSFTVGAGADAAGFPVWPDKDAVTLCENSLHYVIDGAPTKPELVPFNKSLSHFSISEGANAAGARVAVVDVQAGVTDGTLRIRMKLDGTFDSAEVLPKTE